MVRIKISPKEWETLKAKMRNKTEVEKEERELARRKKMADIEQIQYHAADLAYALDIGQIADMWVDTIESGTQVLRLRVIPKKHDDFKTIRAAPKSQTKKTVKRPADNYKPRAKTLQFERDVPAPDTSFGAKAGKFGMDVGKGVIGWLRTPPRKKPEDW